MKSQLIIEPGTKPNTVKIYVEDINGHHAAIECDQWFVMSKLVAILTTTNENLKNKA